ncbi:unnamed protein product, partial [Rotaria socialis]
MSSDNASSDVQQFQSGQFASRILLDASSSSIVNLSSDPL